MSSLALSAALITAACGTPPDKEIQQAQTAIDAARTAGADRFAVEEFGAAQDLLTRAKDAITQRDYRLALNHALDARERAQNAARDATGRMAAAKRDAEGALTDADSRARRSKNRVEGRGNGSRPEASAHQGARSDS